MALAQAASEGRRLASYSSASCPTSMALAFATGLCRGCAFGYRALYPAPVLGTLAA